MPHYDVLIVEDDLALREALFETLEIEGYSVLTACNGTDALSQLAKNCFKLVVSDVQMPVMDGLQLMQNMQNCAPKTPVLLMTAYGTISKAVMAMQLGAVDYLIKPFAADLLVQKVAAYCVGRSGVTDAVVQDPTMQALYALIQKVANTDVTVMLQGESGCGKEVLARFIHQQSAYRDGPFIALNCAAIPEQMLEAILFGYEKGAFTGAVQSVPGKFEIAQGGTLLLDEISEMALGLQVKLLRVLQEKEVERLGSHQKFRLQLRILATTNRNLKAYVAEGRFREDLYYRLSVFPIQVPPLRERSGDILPLTQEFLKRYCTQGAVNIKPPRLSVAAIDKLLKYPWPGNVRELENVIQRALIMHEQGQISAADILLDTDMLAPPSGIQALPSADVQLDIGIRLAEEQIILETLQQQQGSRKKTALKLGVSDRTLRYKIARMKEAGVVIPC